ncbi:hypothetical protein IWQ60_004134 [Tieghemiomyces parasiticus]|uniref:50S ribosomal protein L35 n=1 Tax=Tieghemiomyces parasiticus TaxID=78921 RepID=A0A9W8AGC6_9FUNG|nr:hypothetical protein IWQ60_004134 [Tieghemiomyces parasiticus]
MRLIPARTYHAEGGTRLVQRNPLLQSAFTRPLTATQISGFNILSQGGAWTSIRTKYKMKTHSGTKKRFRLNAKGQFRATHAARAHFNRKVRSIRARATRKPLVLAKAYHNHMKKLMPYAS